MKKDRSLLWLCVAVLFAIGTTILVLSYMVTDPGHVIIQLGGDCGKNYFTYFYHAIYDKGFWFNGMNYPYGEHILYADGQPMLSNFLQFFQPITVTQAVTVLNLLISFSYVLAIVFTYKILIRFDVKPFIAIPFACLINMLAPQVLRTEAHFGLAYLNTIPMLFYWTVAYHSSSRPKWLAYIFVMGFIMSFMHMYVGGIIFFWVAFYAVGYILLIKAPVKQKLKHAIPILAIGLGLFLMIKLCISITDPLKDRPTTPYSSLQYVTHKWDVLTSPYSVFWQYLRDKKGFTRISPVDEGYTYIGLVAIFMIGISFALGLWNLIRKQATGNRIVSEDRFSPVMVFVGVCILLLAMGAPFIWHMEWLLKYLSLFKQFRAMGRFSWAFYYVATVYAVVVLDSLYTRLVEGRRAILAYVLVLVCIAVWSLDSLKYVEFVRFYVARGWGIYDEFFYKNEKVKWAQYLDEHHYKGTDFQGIILFPFFISGSEKLWVGPDPSWPLSIGMRVSLEFHLPIVDVMMSRSSWSIAQKQVKTVAGPYADKPMFRDLKSNKPFLLLHYEWGEIDPDQQYLFSASEFLGKHLGVYVYVCYPDRILANDRKHAERINAVLPFMHASDTCLEDKGTWYLEHYDSQDGASKLFGAGAKAAVDKDSIVLATIPVKPDSINRKYEFSCWVHLDYKDYKSPYVSVQSLDSAGKEIYNIDAVGKNSVDNDSLWYRTSVFFDLKPQAKFVKLVLINTPRPTYLSLDELLLRPADAVIISKTKDGKVMVNGHLFRR